MKTKASKYLEIVIESINYIIISYALSNMAMLFQSNPLFILFFCVRDMGNWKLLAQSLRYGQK